MATLFPKTLLLLFVGSLIFLQSDCSKEKSKSRRANRNSDKKFILCANSKGTINHVGEDGSSDEETSGAPVTTCDRYCYSVWQEGPNNGSTLIIGQGCWDTSDTPNECERTACLADKEPPKAMNMTKFCCCNQTMCNVNFTDAYVPPPKNPQSSSSNSAANSPENLPSHATELLIHQRLLDRHQQTVITWVWVGVSTVVLFLTAAGAMYFFCRIRPPKKGGDAAEHGGILGGYQLHGRSVVGAPPNDYSLDKLRLLNVIGQGRYGCVWRGVVNEQEVAVKVFAAHHRTYFLNEYEMYKISGENSALLKCFGGGEHHLLHSTNSSTPPSSGGPPDYLLILSLEQECLQEYLKNHTLDLATLSKMSLGVARGLAHLHSDLGGKPCIAHRDINTRNILVRSDLTCCLCDLGLAVVPRNAENKSISEAGTLRYMAPEVLEGAVNLRDYESALKQIDVYALGLVLWEMGTRCADMQNCCAGGEPPAPYQPPFYKEAGENPTLEQMQSLVSRRKARPFWPPSWKDTAAARMLSETAEDCWDQDAEARLTSLCVVERLLELPTLKGRVLHPSYHPPASPTPLINNNHLHDNAPLLILHQNQQIDISMGTIETLLSPSMEEAPPHHQQICKNSNQLAALSTPLQPYQGRNPCLERNLLTGSSDSLLVDKSSKHCTSNGGVGNAVLGNLSPGIVDCESENLLAGDYLNYQNFHGYNQQQQQQQHSNNNNSRPVMPIPYLQNAVHGTPKQYNDMGQPQQISNGNDGKKGGRKWHNFVLKMFGSHSNNGPAATVSTKKSTDRIKKHKNKTTTNEDGDCDSSKDTQVKLSSKLVNGYGQNGVTISLLGDAAEEANNANQNGIVSGAVDSGCHYFVDSTNDSSCHGNVIDSIHADLTNSDSQLSSKRPSNQNVMINGGGCDFFVGSTNDRTSCHGNSIDSSSADLKNSDSQLSKRPSTLPLTSIKSPALSTNSSSSASTSTSSSNSKINKTSSSSSSSNSSSNNNMAAVANSNNVNNAINNTSSGVTQLLLGNQQSGNKNKAAVSRQRSLEQFTEVFSTSSVSDLSRLKCPAQRVKTPGDVPPSVRKTRGKAAKNSSSARFSLYDDRMMMMTSYDSTTGGLILNDSGQWWGSAPDLEPPASVKLAPPNPVNKGEKKKNISGPNLLNGLLQQQDRDSVSSF